MLCGCLGVSGLRSEPEGNEKERESRKTKGECGWEREEGLRDGGQEGVEHSRAMSHTWKPQV